MLLHQGCPHCGKFPTAASRRSLDRVSVPVWRIILSDPLSIEALVSYYLTNKLIEHRPLPNRRSFTINGTCGISPPFGGLSLSLGYVPMHYSAVRRSCTLHPVFDLLPSLARERLRINSRSNNKCKALPLDLHVLGTPPAFILSQDQTLHKKRVS